MKGLIQVSLYKEPSQKKVSEVTGCNWQLIHRRVGTEPRQRPHTVRHRRQVDQALGSTQHW